MSAKKSWKAPLLAANDGGEDAETRPLRQRGDAAEDLLPRLRGDRARADGAMPQTDAGVEHAEVIGDFGDGTDGRSRIAGGALLLDADGRGEPADEIDIRLRQLPEELPGVVGEALDVAALPLGVQGVEGEGNFLPEPLTPVKTINLLRGSSKLTLRRLCSRAPRTRMVWLSMVTGVPLRLRAFGNN